MAVSRIAENQLSEVRLVIRACILVGLLIAAAVPVFGAASGLNIIPTADVLPRGAAALEVGLADALAHPFHDHDAAYQSQIGLGSGIEAGYDILKNGETERAWNAKVAVAYRGRNPVAAVGLQNVGKGLMAQPYVVGFVPYRHARIHAGITGIEGNTRAMFGYDRPLSDRVTFQADYTSGDENAASVGVAITLKHNLGLSIAYAHNNTGSDRANYELTIGWYPQLAMSDEQ